MAEFFGYGGYHRAPSGGFSWQHLLYLTICIIVMVSIAVWLGIRNKNKDDKTKNKVLIWTAFFADYTIPANYMFSRNGNGTPYDIVYNMVNGNVAAYATIVIAMYIVYIVAFYLIYFLIKRYKDKKNANTAA